MSAAVELLLLRHGQSDDNLRGVFGGHSDAPLTPRGWAEARATAAALAREGDVSALYSSDLPRAVATTAPVAESLGLSPTLSPALRERSLGELTGLSFADVRARYPDVFDAFRCQDPRVRPPGGETEAECAERLFCELVPILDRHTGGRVVVVSHAMAISLALRRILGLGQERTVVWFRIDNCGLHRLERRSDGRWAVLALNDRAHLAGVVDLSARRPTSGPIPGFWRRP